MQCPSCKTQSLKPAKLEGELPAHACSQCEGALVSLLYYRDWVERAGASILPEAEGATAKEVETSDSHAALACPKCRRLMTKFNISGCSRNRIDLCGTCDEAWLDGGEWELLKVLQLNRSLPSVFTDAWQKKVRKELSDQKRMDRFTRIIGAPDMERAEEIRLWLLAHEKRQELLFYIAQE